MAEGASAQAHVEAGLARLNASDFEQAIRCFDEALQIERDENAAQLSLVDVYSAIEELLFTGGSLNRKLLGAAEADVE